MAYPLPTAPRSGYGRVLKAGAALLVGFLVTTCAESPSAPSRPGFGAIRVSPAFDQFAVFAPLTLDRVRVIVVRAPADTALDQSRNFSVTSQQLQLELPVVLQDARETMAVTLQLLSGSTLLFDGTDSVEIARGANAAPVSIPVTYAGPGANATNLVLAPSDTVVRVGSTMAMRATALDGEGVDVGQFYLNWSLSGAAAGAGIDASGVLTASTVTDTFFVRGITPGGLRDSVRVTVLPAPSSLTRLSGDNQNGEPGEHLPLPLAVLVTGAGSVPLPGVTVSFTATTGGGQVDSASATTDAAGVARSGITLGATPGVQTFTASSAGLTPVVFTATAAGVGPQTRTWSGAVSTDWSVPGNWVGGAAPSASEPAIIGAATRQPSLSATTVVGSVTINSGGVLTINNQTVIISGDLTTAGTGILKMTSANDGVGVTGNAVFGGGDENGSLTAGALQVGGNFTQLSSTSAGSYFATGSHTTALTGATPTVTFASTTGTASAFQNLAWNTSGGTNTLTLGSALFVKGIFSVGGAGGTGLSSTNGSRLTVQGDFAPVLPLVLNNVPLTIDQATTGSTLFVNAGLTFQNMATNVSQLVIRHPGQSAPVVLPGLTFSTVPVAPNGFYLDVTDNAADANVLTINLTGANPASGGAFVKLTGGAVVNWPVIVSGLRTWTGAVSTAWETAGNWSGGQLPQTGDDVLIPEGVSNFPVYAGGLLSIHDLTLESESGETTLTLNGAGGLIITGNLVSNAQVLGTAKVTVSGAGSHTVSGDVMALEITANTVASSSMAIARSLNVSSASPITFDIRDVQIEVGTDFSTGGNATLTMNGGSDLTVHGQATFGGGSTTGLLQGGTIVVEGNFVQSGSPTSFAPSGGNSVVLNGSITQTVQFAAPASAFDNLNIGNVGGAIEVNNTITVKGRFGSSSAGARLGGAGTIVAGGLDLTDFIVDQVRLVFTTNDAAAPASMTNVTFQNYSGAQPQLEINHPGVSSGVLEFDGLVFTGTPTSFYLLASDNANDGVPLVVNLTNANPVNGAGLFNVTNGATVNWPPAPTTWAWTGTTSTNWSVAGNWSPATVPAATSNVTIGATTNQPTLSADVTVNSIVVSTAGARLTLGGHTLTVNGNFTTHTDGLLVSTNAADKLIVGGDAAFQGGDETGLITAGELRLNGGFIQQVQTSPLSFLASGSHRTIMTNASQLQDIHFCCTANTSKFMNLDISNSFGINIQFASNGVFVADTFIVQPGAGPAPTLYMLGSPLTAKRFKINKLIVDRGTLTLNEGGVIGNEQLDNVTFQDYLPTQTQLAIVAPGASVTPRVLPFTNLVFQTLTTGNTGRYINATSTTGTLTLDVTTANVANGPAFTTISGNAIVNWPGATPVNTWTGAVNTNWTTAGNWNLGRIPAATDSVVIPNGVTNFPTLTGRQTVGAMFEDGRLTINGGTLVVTRGSASNTGVNRIIQTTLATDSLLIGGNTSTPISTILGVVVIGGDVTVAPSIGNSRLVLNGAGTQNIAPISGGVLIINKSSGTANLGGFTGDSIDVSSGGLTSTGAITVTTGLSTRTGTTFAMTNTLTVSTSLNVAGQFGATTTDFKPLAAGITIPALAYTNLTVENSNVAGTATLGAHTVITGNLSVVATGTPVTLNLNGKTLVVAGTASTGGGGGIAAIRMNNALDSLLVAGNVTFAAPANANPGFFTAGVLQVGGTFTQSNPFGDASFQATGTHKVILTAFSPSVGFDSPGPAANQSRFNDLTWTGGGTLGVDGVDSLVIDGKFTTTSATSVTVLAAGVNRSIRFGSLAATAQVTFSQIRVTVAQPNVPSPGPDLGLNNMRFFNQDPAKVWLTIQHPGFTGGLTVNNVIFTTVPNNGGFYINATDNNPSDGLPLVVNVTNTTPTNPGGLIQVVNGATINWPPVAPVNTWTGAVSTAWETPGNWSSGAVPTASTDAIVPSGTPNAPTAGAVTSSVKHLTVNTGATLTLTNPFGLTVAGNVDAPGAIAGGGTLNMTAAATLRGTVTNLNITNVPVTLNGATVVGSAGNVTVTGAAGELILDGNSFVATGILFTNNARVLMTNPNDSLVANGTLQFSGGSTLGRLTAGVIDARASFIQQATSSTTSFASTGTRVRATGPGTVTYTFASPGAALSRFDELIIGKSAGILNLNNKTFSTITTVGGGTLNINNQALTTAAGFVVENTGLLQMTSVNDSVLVGGNAFFTGTGNETGQMTAGVLRVAQNLTQSGGNTNFVATGTHKTLFLNTFTSTITFEDPGATAARFQNVQIAGNADFLFTNGGFVNGALTVTGTPNMNANANLNVRGLLTTSAGAGLGLDTLTLGDAVGIAPGSGFINPRVLVLDRVGTQAVPVIPAPSGPDSAKVLVFSDATLDNNVILNGLFIGGSGRLNLNGHTASVFGPFDTQQNGVLIMQNAADNLTVTGVSTFNGGSTAGLLTAGLLTFANDFHQSAVNSTTSFAPSGTHKTRFITSTLRQLDFGSPGVGSGGSHFQDLDLANATSGVNLTVNSIVEGTLSSTGSGKLVSSGQTLTVRQVNLNGFISTGAPLIINEQGSVLTQSVNNVSFTGFAGGGNNVLTFVAAGAAGPRTLTFTALNFNALGIGAANHYVNLSTSNGLPIALTIQGSNQQATGLGFTQVDGNSTVNWTP